MKYYLIDGQYKSWDYLHNSLGYTKSATESVSYNSVINWGSDAGNGYCTDTDDVEAEYFVSGVVGWYNINQLALTVHLYPSDVEDFTVEKNGVVSNAVRMILDGTEYWLIEEEVKGENPYGWMARSVAEQEGWHEYEDVTYDFILVDSTTGRVNYGVENLTEIEFTHTGYFTIDEGNEVIFVEQSPFPVVCIDEGTRTPESIAPDDSFDTELPYYASKLYIVTTDDGQDETLYGWEAEEGMPVSILPQVDLNDNNYISTQFRPYGTIPAETGPLEGYSWTGSQYVISVYDSTKTYAIVEILNASYQPAGYYGIGLSEYNGTIGISNISDETISFGEARFAICDSPDAVVIPVYNTTTGKEYTAFKYTDPETDTDYYFVLDLTHNDWTDDLSNIGYSTEFSVDLIIGFNINNTSGDLLPVTFDYPVGDNYWTTRVKSAADKSILYKLGIWSNNAYKYGSLAYDSAYEYELVEFYTDIGETVAPYNVADFVLEHNPSSPFSVWVLCNTSYSTAVLTCLIRITKAQPPVDNTIYMFGFWYDTNANDWTFEPRGGSDYQWMGITSQEDVTKLSDIGIGVSTTNAAYGPYGCPTDALVNGNYKFVVLGYYDDLAGTTPSQYSDVNNFYMRSMRRDWVYITEIFLTSSISVNVAFYKVRIEAITPELGYFNTSGTAEALPSNTAIPLYRDSVQIPYENGRQYRARGLYDGDGNLITDNPAYFSFSEQNGNLYFSQSYTSGVTAKYISFV